MLVLAASPSLAQPAPPPDIALLVEDTLSCYQTLKRVHAPASIGPASDVVVAIEKAANGDLSVLEKLPKPVASSRLRPITSSPIRHEMYARAILVAVDAHNIHSLRVLYAACHAENAQRMGKLYGARDEQVMAAAHHVVECYYPRAPSRSDTDQCIGSPEQ